MAPPDVIIADWEMQPLDGLEFLRLVRRGEDSANPYIPVIMLTGHTEWRRVVEARDSGATEFVAKPISARALYMRIMEIIERPRVFVKTKKYTGPCRRRRNDPKYKGPERRTGAGAKKAS